VKQGGLGAAVVCAGLLLASFGAARAEPPPATAAMPRAQSDYLLHCGGCHGLDGRSADRLVPTLSNQVGAFACTARGRDYVARLPNVALAPLDDQRLADVLNYVFAMDAHAYRRTTPPYTPAQVADLRRRPLIGAPISAARRELVARFIADCGGQPTLKRYGG
jgi:mono/diheme cytochrome c family protein